MAVFRNVMAFLGLDDDQAYDDEAYYEDEDELTESPPRKRKTIALDERLPASADAPSFGFSADTEMNEMGGVGAVRPLRPVPADEAAIPEALGGSAERRINQPDTAGAFDAPNTSEIGNGGPVGLSAGQIAASNSTDTQSQLAPPDFQSGSARDVPPSPGGNAPGDSASTARPSLTAIDGASAMAHRQSPVEEPQNNVVTHAKPRLHIPSSFDDASRIADDFRTGAPVVMNLSKVDKAVARRLVDFASGVCYALTGGMERAAPNVYLLTPVGIDVSPEDRRRMQDRGFDR